ncbi:type A2 lanthipeptide [Streptococcus suis]
MEDLDFLLGGACHGVNTISAVCRWNSLLAIFTCC